MKKMIALLLLGTLLLSGCSDQLKEPVTFYYIRTNYEEDMSAIIGSEQREASGHRNDLSYLMALYLMGPSEEELSSPLPADIDIVTAEKQGSGVILQLSDTTDSMTDVHFTLACSCLTLTCLEITNADYVTINSGERSVTLEADELLLQDLITGNRMEESQ